jgi:hypothetical protein
MGNILQAVGQANYRPDQAIRTYQNHEQNMAIRKQTLENMEVRKNMLLQKQKEQEEFDKPLDVNVLMSSMAGAGVNGEVTSQYALGLAKNMGYVNQDGTIKAGYAQQLGKMISTEPFHVKRINEGILSSLQGRYNQTTNTLKELSEKGPDNKQFQEALAAQKELGKAIHKQRVALVGSDKMMESVMKWATPESAEQYAKTGDSSVLVKAEDEPKDTRTTDEKNYERGLEDPNYTEWLDRNNGDDEKKTANMRDFELAQKDPEYAKFLKNKSGQVDKRKFADETKMRKEFQSLPEVKNHVLIDSQVQRLDKAMEEAKSSKSLVAVDQALITILNKMLDPSSVVRESEYARTPGDLAFLNQMRGKIEKLKTGGAGLTDTDREAIARMARSFYSVSKGMYDAQEKYYTWLAEGYDYDPKNVVRLGNKATDKPSSPPVSGAKMAPDGNWYVEKDGQYFMVKE